MCSPTSRTSPPRRTPPAAARLDRQRGRQPARRRRRARLDRSAAAGSDTLYGGPHGRHRSTRATGTPTASTATPAPTPRWSTRSTPSRRRARTRPSRWCRAAADDRPADGGLERAGEQRELPRQRRSRRSPSTATDDRGVAKVQFFDDDRLVCEDAIAPYTCAYQARGADVGRNTLIATAVDGANQAGSAVRLVNVSTLPADLADAAASRPARDRRAPYSFRARGRLAGAGACSGTVTITAKAGQPDGVLAAGEGLPHAAATRSAVRFGSRGGRPAALHRPLRRQHQHVVARVAQPHRPPGLGCRHADRGSERARRRRGLGPRRRDRPPPARGRRQRHDRRPQSGARRRAGRRARRDVRRRRRHRRRAGRGRRARRGGRRRAADLGLLRRHRLGREGRGQPRRRTPSSRSTR